MQLSAWERKEAAPFIPFTAACHVCMRQDIATVERDLECQKEPRPCRATTVDCLTSWSLFGPTL